MADGNFGFKVNGFDSYTLLLGEELRGERATLGKSLLQAQKDLKIKAAYISAIENCDLDAFPNKGFIAGYVRSYARYLNLNPEEIYERFCMESGFSSQDGSRKLDSTDRYKNRGLKEHNIETQLDWKPSYLGLQEVNSPLFSRSYWFFGPFLVAFLILFGISFGAWKVLIDIQKLKIVPADNLPMIMSEMNLQSSEVFNENMLNKYQFARKEFEANEFKVSESSKLASPQVSYRDGPIMNLQLEDIGVLGTNSTKLDRSLPFVSSSVGSTLKVSINKFDFGSVPEFGLEASEKIGEAGLKSEQLVNSRIALGYKVFDQDVINRLKENDSLVERSETTLNIFAVNPSWIRIKDEGRKVVVEKILKAGEVLEIKNNWFNGNLRAGNAKDLFFSLNGVTYGPVSDKRKVIKNFKIDPQNIFNSLKINELKDSYLNSLLNKKRTL
ncbi:DUF4115 domain-containing protein [Paracoccaceae bacterium]|nr:DUF4115 domain-containing protein [Paracoccaceae bacterium]